MVDQTERRGEEIAPQVEKIVIKQEPLQFPEERAAIAKIQGTTDYAKLKNASGPELVAWALETGFIKPGDVMMAEVSPSYRCPASCPGCRDSLVFLKRDIALQIVPKIEERAEPETMMENIDLLYQLGVRHFMFIGGTIDALPQTQVLIEYTLKLKGTRVSWFSDGIMLTKINGEPSKLFEKNAEAGWLDQVATHFSIDYPSESDLYGEHALNLPTKKGRVDDYESDPEESRHFKSQYGIVCAKNLVDRHARRVVLNTTVSSKNLQHVLAIYEQVAQLQEYAHQTNSPTEVLWTFSPWIWRPHQARGDSPSDSPASGGLQIEDMNEANRIFSLILHDTWERIAQNRPRLLANSAGFAEWMSQAEYQSNVVNQELPYTEGKPEMLQIHPDGKIAFDPMFLGPELAVANNPFAYRDRESRQPLNAYAQYHKEEQGKPWFPNIITT